MSTVTFYGFGEPRRDPPESQEVWTFNDFYNKRPVKPTRIYQIHDKNDLHINNCDIERYGDTLVIVSEPLGCKNERIFNLKEAIKEHTEKMFTSTICYMFYDSIKENYKEILLNGIQLLHQTERSHHVPAVLRWMDICRSKGIKVESPFEPTWRRFPEAKDVPFYGNLRLLKEI